MQIGTACFLMFLIFLTHEFEEIIRFRPWVLAYGSNPAYANESIVRQRAAYPSTEVVAIIVAAMCGATAALLGFALWQGRMEGVLGVLIANAIHLLLFHLQPAVTRRQWVPGSVTALLMSMASLALWNAITKTVPIHIPQLVLMTVCAVVVLLGTLTLMHRLAPSLQQMLNRHH